VPQIASAVFITTSSPRAPDVLNTGPPTLVSVARAPEPSQPRPKSPSTQMAPGPSPKCSYLDHGGSRYVFGTGSGQYQRSIQIAWEGCGYERTVTPKWVARRSKRTGKPMRAHLRVRRPSTRSICTGMTCAFRPRAVLLRAEGFRNPLVAVKKQIASWCLEGRFDPINSRAPSIRQSGVAGCNECGPRNVVPNDRICRGQQGQQRIDRETHPRASTSLRH
jgi:hypothetical protein